MRPFRRDRVKKFRQLLPVRIVVTGLLGQYAFGGVTWDYLQYLLGFHALGTTCGTSRIPARGPTTRSSRPTARTPRTTTAYLDSIMSEFGFGDRWIYRNGATGVFYGAGERAARRRDQARRPAGQRLQRGLA